MIKVICPGDASDCENIQCKYHDGTYTPAAIIRQAREKAEKALMETCSDEINRIVKAFEHDTGLPVLDICFEFADVSTFGGGAQTVLARVELRSHPVR